MYTENTNKTIITDETRAYSLTQVAELFGVAKSTIVTMIRDGRLDGCKVKGRYMITEDSLKRLVLGDKK